MVFNLRQQLFDQLLRLPTEYFDANAQGHIVSRITFTVTCSFEIPAPKRFVQLFRTA